MGRLDKALDEAIARGWTIVELLAYLRTNGFKTFIVSGAGQDFIRVFADKTYCVPPEQVVGSTTATPAQEGVD